jgi:hypothetical protein
MDKLRWNTQQVRGHPKVGANEFANVGRIDIYWIIDSMVPHAADARHMVCPLPFALIIS